MITVILEPEKTTFTPAVSTVLEEVEILGVNDLFYSKKIVAGIKGLPQSIVLWSGDEEYEAAGVWTNESALARATEVLSLSAIPWIRI